MMNNSYRKLKATALCLDIRDFTPTLSENIKNKTDNMFYNFLSDVYQLGVNLATELTHNNPDSFYINSTGDGFICVFLEEEHFYQAYFMGLALINEIEKLTNQYSNKITFISNNRYKFGIGIETGEVVKVCTNEIPSIITSYIGDAINLAARIEAKTKEYENTPMIYGEHINNLLCLALYHTDYDNIASIVQTKQTRKSRKDLNDDMNYFNDIMISDFLHSHTIKGADFERLYKISVSEYTQTRIDKYPLLDEPRLPLFYKLFFIKYSNSKGSKTTDMFIQYHELLKACFCSFLKEQYPSIKNLERQFSKATICERIDINIKLEDLLVDSVDIHMYRNALEEYYRNNGISENMAKLRALNYIAPVKQLKEFYKYQEKFLQ